MILHNMPFTAAYCIKMGRAVVTGNPPSTAQKPLQLCAVIKPLVL